MRRPLSIAAALLGAGLWTACGSNGGGKTEIPPASSLAASAVSGEPERAPGFSLLDTKGQTVALADFKGKVVFIDFWATWCPPCRISMPEVERLNSDYRGKGLQVLGLSVDDDPDDVRKFVEKKHIPYPILLAGNSDIASAYRVRGIPHFALVDREGRLVEMWSGYAPDMGDDWRAAIDKLLGAGPPRDPR